MSLRHSVPDGPVLKLVRKIVATDTPTSSSEYREGWGGRRFHGPGGECFAGMSKKDGHRWCVQWDDAEGSHRAEFLATVTWERVR